MKYKNLSDYYRLQDIKPKDLVIAINKYLKENNIAVIESCVYSDDRGEFGVIIGSPIEFDKLCLLIDNIKAIIIMMGNNTISIYSSSLGIKIIVRIKS